MDCVPSPSQATILLALDVFSLVNGEVTVPIINVTDDSYNATRPANVTYEGIVTPTPGNQIVS